MAVVVTPSIPQYITVHLGPPDSNAENVTVSFSQYIKNVASSEIYPTWNEAAIYANIYAQISYALNRVYTNFYRSRGYDFDITSSTAYDQKFINGRTIFDNISRIVDNIFTTYIRRLGRIEPLAAKYAPCDSEEKRRAAIEKEIGGVCIMELHIEHMTGKQAVELMKHAQK